MNRFYRYILIFSITHCFVPIAFSQISKNVTASNYSLKEIKLLPSIFTHAMEKDHEWLLELNPDRLLSGFRSEAGLQPKAPKYGGWESQGVAGQTLGHYLSACAFMYADTGDTALLNRINYVVDELALCQDANENGYVAALPGGKKVFDEIAKGNIRSKGFDLNGGWVPWYVIHKLCAGLIDVYKIAGNEKAENILIRLADWAIDEHKNLSYEQMQQILRCEQGGICESFAEVYALTGNKKYLNLAERFNDDALLKPLAEYKDVLPGLHANTQIPKIIGLARQYELTNSFKDSAIAGFFWRMVIKEHSYANGGNSETEHFGMPYQIASRLSNKTTETCNSYNMLKLTHHLFNWQPNVKYADYYEQTLYNHILGSQNPANGMVTYFTPLAAGYKKSFSSPFESFWCCVGTGLENHGKYGEFIYSRSSDNGIFVNLFIPSALKDMNTGIQLTMQTQYPNDTVVNITVNVKKKKLFPLYLRLPAWANNQSIKTYINNKPVKSTLPGGNYLRIFRVWNNGDKVKIEIPFQLRIDHAPDDSTYAVLFYGPLLLCSDLGKGFHQEKDSIPVIITSNPSPSYWLHKLPDSNAFKTTSAYPQQIVFTPFYKEIQNPYQVYFRLFTKAEWAKEKNFYFNKAAQAVMEKQNTVDELQLSEMQPERDHDVQGEKTEIGIIHNNKYRKAEPGGWFSFRLKIEQDNIPQKLVLTYPGGVSNESGFDIFLDGKLLASDAVHWFDGNTIDKFYLIPVNMLKGKSSVVIKLQGKPGKIAGELIKAKIVKE